MIAEEDRISNLPDDIIHHILSFLDLKYSMQTSALSKKWRHVWTLLPQLNLDSHMFKYTLQFDKFVKHALFHRNSCREVSSLELRCKGASTQFTVKSIVNYACLHNVRRLSMVWSRTKHVKFPEFLFSCRALTDLTLAVDFCYKFHVLYDIPESDWDFPALETLNLSNFRLCDGKKKSISLFPKCVKLKDLTLHQFDMRDLEELNLCAPKLSNLTITSGFSYPKVFNVFAPQLQNLTASVDCILELHRCGLLQKSVDGFDSLERVNLSWSRISFGPLKKETHLPQLLSVFQKLYSAKFLILDPFIIQVLSSCLDQLLVERCPFNYLKCLKMNTVLPTTYGWSATIPERIIVPVQLKNYFLDKSPSATFITDYPQVPQKRSCEQVHNDATAKKMAKLDVELQQPDTPIAGENRMVEAILQMKDHIITNQKAMFEAKIQMQDQTITKQKAMFEAKLQMQDQAITKQKAKLQMQDQVITKQKAMFEAKIEMQDQVIIKDKAKIQMQDQVITNQRAMFEAKLQMQDQVITKHKAKTQMQGQVITKQKAMFEAQIQMQDDIIAEQKAEIQMLDAAKLEDEKVMLYVIKSKISELQVQVESGNPDYEVITSIGCEIKSVMELIPESLRVVMQAQFSLQYVELKNLFFTSIDASQWAKIDTELGIINGL